METHTYLCNSCKRAKNVSSRNKKGLIKTHCFYCNKKQVFSLHDEILLHSKLKGFCTRFTLNGYISIQCDHVHIDGIGVRGNVDVTHSTGSQLNEMQISKQTGKDMTGNINIKNSNVGGINSNIASGDINVDSSSVDTINKNMIGIQFDNDELVLEIINQMLGNQPPDDVIEKLSTLSDVLEKNPETANKIGQVLNEQNNKNKGLTGTILLRNLKKIGIDTLSKASDKGLDRLFDWFMAVINNP